MLFAFALAGCGRSDAGPGASTVTVLRFEVRDRLEVRGRETQEGELPLTVHLGQGAAREDRGETISFILLADRRVLYRLDHELRIYQEYAVPVRLEEVLPPSVTAGFRQLNAGEALTRVEITEVPPGEVRGVEGAPGGPARRAALAGTVGRYGFTVDATLVQTDAPFLEEYPLLLRNVGALSPIQRLWSARLAEEAEEGILPVDLRVEAGRDGYRRTWEQRLVAVGVESVRESQLAALFKVPEGYAPAPAHCLSDVTVGSDPACRSISRLDR